MTEAQTNPWGPGRPARLPVLETAWQAYRLLWSHRDDVLRLAAVPVLLSFGLGRRRGGPPATAE